MIELARGLDLVRDHCLNEAAGELVNVLLNATSPTEAALSMRALQDVVPERALVAACNLREAIAELPLTPLAFAVDEPTLARVAELERTSHGSLDRTLPDGTRLSVPVAGNLALDVVLTPPGEESAYLSPVPRTTEWVTPRALAVIVQRDGVFEQLVALTQAMGLVFNPKFYLSTADFLLEYATESFRGIEDLF